LFRSFGPCAGHKSKETRNSGNVFFRLGAFSAPGQGRHPALRAAPAAQCPNHVRARWPDRKVLRVRRGGRLERRRGCGRVAERHAWPPWGPRGTPSPSRTQSPGAARRRAAGAQRAGEPIGCKAARPRGCASPPGIFAMAAECKPPALAVAGVSPAEEEDAQRLLAQWMELSQREAGPVSARVRVRPGWAAPSWPAPPCSRSPCVVAGRRPRVPSCSAGRSGRPRAVSLVRRRRPRRCVHDTGAQRLLCPGGRGWLAPRYT